MKFKRTKQILVIECESGREFEERMNAALLEADEPKIIYTGSYAAIIEYTKEVYKGESLADEARLEDGEKHCQECPYIELSADKRTKWHWCPIHNKKVLKTSFCCDEFYEERRQNVPEVKGRDESAGPERKGPCGNCEGKAPESLQRTNGAFTVQPVGARGVARLLQNK